jgi:hypothetical protein
VTNNMVEEELSTVDEQALSRVHALRAVRRAPAVAVTTYANTQPTPYVEHGEIPADTADITNHDHWRHVQGRPIKVAP